MKIQGVPKAPDWLPALDAAVPQAQLAHLRHHRLLLEQVDVPALLARESPKCVVLSVAALQIPRRRSQLIKPPAELLEGSVKAVAGCVEVCWQGLVSCLAGQLGREDDGLGLQGRRRHVSIVVDCGDRCRVLGIGRGQGGHGYRGWEARRKFHLDNMK